MAEVDVLVVTALQEEFDAARDVASAGNAGDLGVESWKEHEEDPPPYHLGEYRLGSGGSLLVALARPTDMGGTATGAVAGFLAERLRPRCLAMSGVCAGNPAEVILGDVIFASFTYRYQEGKQTSIGFHPDHRQTPAHESWIRAAQDLPLTGLSTNGPASEDEARRWVLERLLAKEDPRTHRARSRYIADEDWAATLARLENDGLITMPIDRPQLTEAGDKYIRRVRYLDVSPPRTLPYRVITGPVASGDVVVKDGLTWDQLRAHGVETVAGLEMEAATVARTARSRDDLPWIVIKGVMDYADPRKDDRFKPFAARASAQVLFRLLASRLGAKPRMPPHGAASPVMAASRPPSAAWTRRADTAHDRWRPLAQPLPAIGPLDLGVPRQRGKTIVELCLVPAEPMAALEARRLAALPAELTALGRRAGLFASDQDVSETCQRSAVADAAGAGLAITRDGKRCGWQELPKDTLGSVLDQDDLTARLAALVTALAGIDAPRPQEAGLAVAVTPTVLLSEGRVADLPRTSRGRTSLTPVRVPAADVLPWAQIVGHSADVSAELSARLLLAFRSQQGNTRS